MPKALRYAKTVDGLVDSVFSKLAERASKRREPPLPLHVGDTYLTPVVGARAEDQESDAIAQLHNYAPVQGDPRLLDAVERHLATLGPAPSRGQIQIVSGATSGLSIAVGALVDPGEDVLVLAPFWPLIRGIVRKRGARAIEVPVMHELPALGAAEFKERLRSHLTPQTSAIYVNTPHNPTGAVLGDEHLDAIREVAEETGAWVLSDEVYDELVLDGRAHARAWCRPGLSERTVAVHSLSKAYGLAGARVGFCHGPAPAMKAIRRVQVYETYCSPRPMQHAAAYALDNGREWIARARERYREAARVVADALDIAEPAGGTFVFADVSGYLRPGEPMDTLLEEFVDAGVLVTPGLSSGDAFERWIRVCFTCVPPDDIAEGSRRIRGVLDRRRAD